MIPPKEDNVKEDKYDGAYVKDPITGMHNWIVSFDINSLYPHLIMQYNISPEKIIGVKPSGISVDRLLKHATPLTHLKTEGACITPNGAMFKTDSPGFLPRLMEKMYNDRVKFKTLAFQAKKEYQKTKDPKTAKEISRCHNIQWAKKIALNSAYGAIGNQYFRYYDVRQATAITTSGQFVIRFIEKNVNEYMNRILKTHDKVDYIVASDTDSIYLGLDKLVEKVCKDKTKEQKLNFVDKVAKQKIEPFIEKCFVDEPKITVKSYDGLTIDFCKEIDANFILRGIRNNGDFEFEKAIARTNRKLSKIETVFLLTSAKTSFISSSIVRDLIKNKGDYHLLVPDSVKVN